MKRRESQREQSIARLRALIDGSQVGMLTVQGADGKLRSRPMLAARHEFDGDLWFFAIEGSTATGDALKRPMVNVAFAMTEKRQFVSVSGTAEIVSDRQRMELLWKDELRAWFREGLATENLVLLRIAVEEAEFWEEHRLAAGILSAMTSWKDSFERVHQKVDWTDTPSVEEASLEQVEEQA